MATRPHSSRRWLFVLRGLFPGHGAVADVAAQVHVLPADLTRQMIGALLGIADAVAKAHHAQHPATIGEGLAIGDTGAGVEDFFAFDGVLGETRNDIALA